MRAYIALILPFILFLGCSAPKAHLPTVASVDLQRYSGLWYEIARYENRFEKGCVGASATYEIKADHVSVTNRCYDAGGTITGEAEGKAYSLDERNSTLEVSFFWPFYGDYQIIMLDPHYRYSVVGEPSRRYLWILARSQHLDDETKRTIIQALPAFGYDPAQLYWCRYEHPLKVDQR